MSEADSVRRPKQVLLHSNRARGRVSISEEQGVGQSFEGGSTYSTIPFSPDSGPTSQGMFELYIEFVRSSGERIPKLEGAIFAQILSEAIPDVELQAKTPSRLGRLLRM